MIAIKPICFIHKDLHTQIDKYIYLAHLLCGIRVRVSMLLVPVGHDSRGEWCDRARRLIQGSGTLTGRAG